MDQDIDDAYAPIEEPLDDGGWFEQGGPGLFDAPEQAPTQEGPGLFDDPAEGSAASVTRTPTTAHAAAAAPVAEVPEAPLALYRRYRPDTFGEVIGQDHVTVPLMRALDNNRVNHAYLFSGPRGCGKTTSARILARCLNCAQGPTSTPCGVCRSCEDLARGGPGSIDVIEIDAASHGGVDDARDLRERAFFAPVHSRYKVYIVDEAHMVTTAGFNALLKLVEEPPPHAKFVFATTEPEKVIGTIRSRTHHYPFRLVPPRLLGDYLTQLAGTEGVKVDPAAVPLVVRAGGGSVRDSLSVLDQLLGGSGPEGVSHEQAAALLGFTPDALLDEIVDAFAAGDSAGVFRTIDRVIEIGQDPRRFAEDLLQRLRDLVIVAAVPQAAENGMLEVSDDQAARLTTQAAGLGPGELTRAAEVIATGLTEMRGTTAPRLHLELMCARVLLPAADTQERGLHARLDRLERRLGVMGAPEPVPNWSDVPGTRAPAARAESAQPPARAEAIQPQARSAAPPEPGPGAAPEPAHRPEPAPAAAPPAAEEPARRRRPAGEPPRKSRDGRLGKQSPAPATPSARPEPRSDAAVLTAAELRRVWPGVLEEVKKRRRFSFMLLSQNAQVVDLTEGQLLLGFSNSGARENFTSSGSNDVLADSLIQVIGADLRIQAILTDPSGGPQERRPQQRPPARPQEPPAPVEQHREEPPPPEPEPDVEPEIGADDADLTDAHATASALLSATFDAEVIDES
ncbi:MAG: DNA polymerase III subunit gamma and tau [Arachnia sp.]